MGCVKNMAIKCHTIWTGASCYLWWDGGIGRHYHFLWKN